MAKPSGYLAESLEVLHELQARGGVAMRSGGLSRTHRERQIRNGFLHEVITGWNIPARPGIPFWPEHAHATLARFIEDPGAFLKPNRRVDIVAICCSAR
jgi:hypothetical protein